jgi:glycosyltransferase involved in cell wall biosynthesis
MPAISVILPFYNAADTLGRAIRSIAAQTFFDFECILIDNNSADGSRAIAETWTERDPRFSLIREARQGVVFASNAGAAQARGEYVARMDADDVAMPERLELQAVFLDENPDFGAVSGLVEYVPHDPNTEGFSRYVHWVNSVRSYEDILNNRFVESPVVNPTAMWRKTVSDQYGLYRPGNFPEDYELWLRWLAKGVRIRKLDRVVLQWHDSETRLTRTDPVYSYEAFYRIKTRYLATWLAGHDPHPPRIAIWGASRTSRRRAELLHDYGIDIECYIDIKKTRQLDKPLVYFENIPPPGYLFILVYVPLIEARNRVQAFLESRGYRAGHDYLLAS